MQNFPTSQQHYGSPDPQFTGRSEPPMYQSSMGTRHPPPYTVPWSASDPTPREPLDPSMFAPPIAAYCRVCLGCGLRMCFRCMRDTSLVCARCSQTNKVAEVCITHNQASYKCALQTHSEPCHIFAMQY